MGGSFRQQGSAAGLARAERFSAEETGKPNLAGDRTSFTYAGVLAGLPESSAPDLKNKSFSVTARVNIEDNANGMIFTQGGNTGGWAFYLKDGKLKAAHNYIDVAVYSVESDDAVPAGERELKMDFTYEGGEEMGKSGTLTLSVDGSPVGTGQIAQTTPFKYSLSENQDVGTDTGTAVTTDYQAPFDFQGELEEGGEEMGKSGTLTLSSTAALSARVRSHRPLRSNTRCRKPGCGNRHRNGGHDRLSGAIRFSGRA